jgi:acetyl-CoA carboxylase biotin carboxyl carrier protein
VDALQIKAFIDAMASSGLAEMEASKDGWTLRLVRDAARTTAAPLIGAPPAPALAFEQCAALCGVVFLRPSPAEPPFVRPGQRVSTGETLCVIEAMKVFNEVCAERDGIVDAVLVESGQDVEAGQPLLRLR